MRVLAPQKVIMAGRICIASEAETLQKFTHLVSLRQTFHMQEKALTKEK
jgi:hypothetical protein